MTVKKPFIEIVRSKIFEKDTKGAIELIEKNPQCINDKTLISGTLLHDAVRYNCVELTEYLVKSGIDINVETPQSGNAINYATSIEMLKYLLSIGLKIDMDLNPTGKNPLFKVVKGNNIDLLCFLLEHEIKTMNKPEFTEGLLNNTWELAETMSNESVVEMLEKIYQYKPIKDRMIQEKEFEFNNFKVEVKEAIKLAFKNIVKVMKKDIYCFAFSSDYDMRSIGVYANTEEYLKELSEEISDDYKYEPVEWEISYAEDKVFGRCIIKIKEYLEQINNQIRKREFRNELFDMYLSILKELKDENFFISQYSKKILLLIHINDYYSPEELISNAELLNDINEVTDYIRYIKQNYI